MKISVIGKPEGCKLLRIFLEVTEPLNRESIIMSLNIHGDFFAIPEEQFEEIEQELAGTRLGHLGENFDMAVADHRIQIEGISGRCVMEILRSVVHGI